LVAERVKKDQDAPPPAPRQSCSFVHCDRKWTRDGNIVVGHNTMQSYADVLPSVIEDILPRTDIAFFGKPARGGSTAAQTFHHGRRNRGSETTIGGFDGFDTNGIPEFARMRRATQDAGSIEAWCETMKRGNNGGYANAWLLGDVNTGEIARLELGLKYVGYEKKKDGYFLGSNVAEDRKILRLETEKNDTDIRASSIARRVRWKELMKQHAGRLTWNSPNALRPITQTCIGERCGPAAGPFAVISISIRTFRARGTRSV